MQEDGTDMQQQVERHQTFTDLMQLFKNLTEARLGTTEQIDSRTRDSHPHEDEQAGRLHHTSDTLMC